jgi:hypothetical protein
VPVAKKYSMIMSAVLKASVLACQTQWSIYALATRWLFGGLIVWAVRSVILSNWSISYWTLAKIIFQSSVGAGLKPAPTRGEFKKRQSPVS